MDIEEQRQLQTYLREIERYLSSMNVVDRSDTLLELNSHINESLEQGRRLDEILRSLGTPLQAANRYLAAKGLPPTSPIRPGSSFLKWTALGVLGLMAAAVISVVLLVRSFFPFVEVDEKEGRVKILGGMIDVNEDENHVSLGTGWKVHINEDEDFSGDDQQKIEGTLATEKLKEIVINATNARMDLRTANIEEISYKCRVGRSLSDEHQYIDFKDDKMFFQFKDKVSSVRCKIKIPKGKKVTFDVVNASMRFKDPVYPMAGVVLNGDVRIDKDSEVMYDFDVDVKNGLVSGDRNQEDPTGKREVYKVHLRVTNGLVRIR